jgi:hypothetical protein
VAPTTLDYLNTAAGILSAFATFAAVIAALYLARRDELLRLHLDAATGGILTNNPRFEVLIDLANLGRRPVAVTSLGWRVGFRARKRYVLIQRPDPHSATLPVKLQDGDSAIVVVLLKDFDEFINGVLPELPKWERRLLHRSLRVVAGTSAGGTFERRVHPTLVRRVSELRRGFELH